MTSKVFTLFLMLFAIVATAITFNFAVEYSAFAAGLLKASLVVSLFVLFDKFVLKGINTIDELKKGNIAYAILLLAIALLFSVSLATAESQPTHITIAESYIGTTENSNMNDGAKVMTFQHFVGLEQGQPYCAAFVSYVLDSAKVESPSVRSGLAQHFIRSNSISAKQVLRGAYTPEAGMIIVWKRGNGPFGHAGFLVAMQEKKSLLTIEANVWNNKRSRQGIWYKTRTIMPGNYFRITHFTPVNYAS